MANDVELVSDHTRHVHLPRAPLASVIGQIRWPELTQLSDGDQTVQRSFASAIAKEYPFRSELPSMNFVFGPDGVKPQTGPSAHQYRAADDSWRVNLTAVSLTLEARRYTDIDDFAARFQVLFEALSTTIAIPAVDRVGFRYFNRVGDAQFLSSLPTYLAPAVLGGQRLLQEQAADLQYTLTDSQYVLGQRVVRCRWGSLPAGASIDPSIEAVAMPTWVLDIDTSSNATEALAPREAAQRLIDLAAVGYDVFQSATTVDFLRYFGGEV